MRMPRVFPSLTCNDEVDGDNNYDNIKDNDKNNRKEDNIEKTKTSNESIEDSSIVDKHKQIATYLKAPRLIFQENGHKLSVTSLSYLILYNNDNNNYIDTLIFSGSDDKIIMIWSLVTGMKVGNDLIGHNARVTGIVTYYEPNHQTPILISSSWDETVRIWELNEFLPSHLIKNMNGKCYNQDSVPLDSTSEDSVPLINKSYKEIILKGHTNRIFGLALIDDRPHSNYYPMIASGGADNLILVWLLPRGQLLFRIEVEADPSWNLSLASWFIDEAIVESWATSTSVNNKNNNKKKKKMSQHSKDKRLHDSSSKLHHHHHNHQEVPILLSGCKNGKLRLFYCDWPKREYDFVNNETMNTEIHHLQKSSSQSSLSLSKDQDHNNMLQTKLKANLIETFSSKSTIYGHFSSIHCLDSFDYRKESLVVTCCSDLIIRVFNIESGDLKRSLHGHTERITCVTAKKDQISSDVTDDALIISCTISGSIRIWNYATGEVQRTLNGHILDVFSLVSFSLPGSDKSSDLVVISACKDCTIRSWLYAQEQAFSVIKIGDKRKVGCIDYYFENDIPYAIVGTNDGYLRCYEITRQQLYSQHSIRPAVDSKETTHTKTYWKIQAHNNNGSQNKKHEPVTNLVIYAPQTKDNQTIRTQHDAELQYPFVISTGRTGVLQITSTLKGNRQICSFIPHRDYSSTGSNNNVVILKKNGSCITAISIYRGSRYRDPFFVTGSEDNDAMVWSMFNLSTTTDFVPLYRITELHSFDISAIVIFEFPLLSNNYDSLEAQEKCANDIFIATAGMDNMIYLYKNIIEEWSHVEEFKSLSSSYITSLAVMIVPSTSSPSSSSSNIGSSILVAGDGDGIIYIYSLVHPYGLITMINGHTEEITSLYAIMKDNQEPLLASASLDCLTKIWDLNKMIEVKTIEGHTAEVTCVKLLVIGADLSLLTGSDDSTVRCMYDFLDNTPKSDLIKMMFEFDMRYANNNRKTRQDSNTRFPRIKRLSQYDSNNNNSNNNSSNTEQFFSNNYKLFIYSLRFTFDVNRDGNIDELDLLLTLQDASLFIKEFLPLSQLGLLKALGAITTESDDTEDYTEDAIDEDDLKSLSWWDRFFCLVNSCNIFIIGRSSGDNSSDVDDDGDERFPLVVAKAEQVVYLSDEMAQIEKSMHQEQLNSNLDSDIDLVKNSYKINQQQKQHHQQRKHSYKKYRSLLRQAVEINDNSSVHVIIDSCIALYQTNFEDIVEPFFDVKLPHFPGHMSRRDYLVLAEKYPEEFERLICCLKLLPYKGRGSEIAIGSDYLYKGSDGKWYMNQYGTKNPFRELRRQVKSVLKTLGLIQGDDDVNEDVIGGDFLYLPLTAPIHMRMLEAYTKTCESLDSLAIFDSDAGKLALSYAWNKYGLKTHWFKFSFYLMYVAVYTSNVLTFPYFHESNWFISLGIICLQLLMDVTFIYSEKQQFLLDPLLYMHDMWNQIDIIVITCSITANVIRIVQHQDSNTSRIFISLGIIFNWFDILYYLRAFESTGPLVSMILRICQDSQYLMYVLMLVIIGFSLAFYVISEPTPGLPFSDISNAFLNSYQFLLGGFDPTSFQGLELYSYGVFLSCIYMLFVTIILLNLLIALMGSSYSSVEAKGLAQWRLEQAQIIVEMQESMSDFDTKSTSMIYVLVTSQKFEDLINPIDNKMEQINNNQTEQLLNQLQQQAATIEELKKTQAEMKKSQDEIFNLLKQQIDFNKKLEQIVKQ